MFVKLLFSCICQCCYLQIGKETGSTLLAFIFVVQFEIYVKYIVTISRRWLQMMLVYFMNYFFKCQPSVVWGLKNCWAQMLYAHIASVAPVPSICQVLWQVQNELSEANGSKSVTKQECDSSTCVSANIRLSFSHPDKEADHWLNEKGFVSSWQAGAIKESDCHIAHLPPHVVSSWQLTFIYLLLITLFILPFHLCNLCRDKFKSKFNTSFIQMETSSH